MHLPCGKADRIPSPQSAALEAAFEVIVVGL
jgi:hypothetical protein